MPKDFIEKHIDNISSFKNSVSCGVSDEAGIESLSYEYRHNKLSDIFSTNNSLVPIKLFTKTGLFDLAYDHGIRADRDLGIRLYLNGTLSYLEPSIRVYHHRATTGGLRYFNQRKITYHASRNKLFTLRIPAVTEFYLSLRYHSSKQNREMDWIAIFSTFSISGGKIKTITRIIFAMFMLPLTVYKIKKRRNLAKELLANFPKIPAYDIR